MSNIEKGWNAARRLTFIPRSVEMGDIDPNLRPETIRQKIRDEHLRDSTVTIVLVGEHTWKRKHVDWEIGMSIRQTQHNSRSGLVGLILPTNPYYAAGERGKGLRDYYASGLCYYQTIPPRLWENIACGYAECYFWPGNGHGPSTSMREIIQRAYDRRTRQPDPDNSYDSYANNRDSSAIGWSS